MANKRIDQPTGTETVGHEWDGIEELNTPLPRWWLWTFYLTIIFAVGYVIAYPAWPLITQATSGMLGWSSRGQLSQDLSQRAQEQQGLFEELSAVEVSALRDNPELFRKAVAGGQAAFKLHCSQCHGSTGAGSQTLGYPNLNDDDWLWGGDLDAIHYSVNYGIRQMADNDKRQSVMPAFAGAFDADQLDAVAEHVMSFTDRGKSTPVGEQLYIDNCVTCHGVEGEGDRLQGAPKLNDAIWLRGGSKQEIVAQMLNPRMGAMPAWGERLDPVTVKMLTAYIHSLGGGEQAAPTDVAATDTEAETEDGEQES